MQFLTCIKNNLSEAWEYEKLHALVIALIVSMEQCATQNNRPKLQGIKREAATRNAKLIRKLTEGACLLGEFTCSCIQAKRRFICKRSTRR